MIRFDRIRARNMGVLRDVDIDLAAIPGTLVAVTGPNGSGKSTLLGLLAGALYREAPTRGSLVDLARSRDASLEVDLVNGQPWTVKHLVDGVSKKSEASAYDSAGSLATDSGKVRAFDAWASTALPRPEVFLSSVFLPQGSRGFLGLSPGEKKGVLLRVLGVERLEALAAQARESLTAARWKRDLVVGRMAEVGDADVEGALERAARAVARVEEAAAAVDAATAGVERAERERSDAAAEMARADDRERRRETLAKAMAAATARHADLERRAANNRALVARDGEIRAAAARVAEIGRELAVLAEEQRGHRREEEARAAARAAAGQRLASCQARERQAQVTVARAREQLDTLCHQVDGAERDLPAVARNAELAQRGVGALDAERSALRSRHVAGLGERLGSLRHALVEIVQFDDIDHRDTARLAIQADDAAELAAVEVPPRLADVERRLAAAEAAARGAEVEFARLERLAARRAEVDGLRGALAQAEADLAQATEERVRCDREIEALSVAGSGELHAARAAELADERRRLERAAQALPGLDAAAARIAELEPQIADAQTEVAAHVHALAELGPPVVVAPPDTSAVIRAKRALEDATRLHQEAIAARGAADVAAERAAWAAERLAELRAEAAVLADDVADWTRLAEDLGRDGLQAAEIDAAGPELTEFVNDLLRTCVGPRWTVTIETQRMSSDGKKLLEGLEVRVLDTERGREAPAETLSGGEAVLVGEAVSLAITMLACRRAGVRGATLIRDESGAALDPSAARAYVAMLRRAAQIVGARQVLVVSHSAEVVEMADARIVLDNGTAVVA